MRGPLQLTLIVQRSSLIVQKSMFTEKQLAELLEIHGLGPLRNYQRIRRGEVNPTFLINGTIMLRVNAREPESDKFYKEAAIYRRLAVESDLPTPRLLALDTSRRTLPYDLLLLERLEGRNALDLWPIFS